jgi:DNA-binding MarR family transcriptional regulator
MQKPEEADVLLLVYELGRLIRTRSDQRARGHGMTRAQWVILSRLERQPGMTQNELAAIVEVEPITIARLVDRLEARGFVERRADPSDRRLRRLHLLPASDAVLKEIHLYKADMKALMSVGISAERIEPLVRDLQQMKANLLAEPRCETKAG